MRRNPARSVVAGFLGLLMLLPATAGCSSRADAGSGEKPNVLMVMTDDQWLESMRIMSHTKRLVGEEGVTFDRYHPSTPLCCPSRSTYLSGQFAHNNGVRHNKAPQGGYDKLNEKKTLPVWMQKAGYVTSHIGKYPNGYGVGNPEHVPPGWDEWRGSVDPTTYRMWGYRLNENGKLHTYGKPGEEDPELYQTDVYRDKGADFIERKAKEGKPFFLSMAFLAPHSEARKAVGKPPSGEQEKGAEDGDGEDARETKAEDAKETKGEDAKAGEADRRAGPNVGLAPRPAPRHKGEFADEKLPEDPSYGEDDMRDKPAFLRRRPDFDASTTERITESYRGRLEALLAVDEAVEMLIGTLEKTGQLDNTYVLFTSDNGFFFGQHRVPTGKFLPHGTSGQVPMMMRGPGLKAGEHSGELTSNADLAATIADIGGADPDLPLDGRSMLPYGRDPNSRSGRPVLQEIAEGARRSPVKPPAGGGSSVASGAPPRDDSSAGQAAGDGDLDQDGEASPPVPKGGDVRRGGHASAAYEAIRTERYLYIRYVKGGRELYDLAEDPHELTSRHNDPGYGKVRTFLDDRLDELQGCAGAECRKEIPQPPAPAD